MARQKDGDGKQQTAKNCKTNLRTTSKIYGDKTQSDITYIHDDLNLQTNSIPTFISKDTQDEDSMH